MVFPRSSVHSAQRANGSPRRTLTARRSLSNPRLGRSMTRVSATSSTSLGSRIGTSACSSPSRLPRKRDCSSAPRPTMFGTTQIGAATAAAGQRPTSGLTPPTPKRSEKYSPKAAAALVKASATCSSRCASSSRLDLSQGLGDLSLVIERVPSSWPGLWSLVQGNEYSHPSARRESGAEGSQRFLQAQCNCRVSLFDDGGRFPAFAPPRRIKRAPFDESYAPLSASWLGLPSRK